MLISKFKIKIRNSKWNSKFAIKMRNSKFAHTNTHTHTNFEFKFEISDVLPLFFLTPYAHDKKVQW